MKDSVPKGFKGLASLKEQTHRMVNGLYNEQDRMEKKLENFNSKLETRRLFQELVDSCFYSHTLASRVGPRDHDGKYFFINKKGNYVLVREFLEEGKLPKFNSGSYNQTPVVGLSEIRTRCCPFCKNLAYVLGKTVFYSLFDDEDTTYTTSVICFSCQKAKQIKEITV
ncbi:MAG: hypothetical protein KGJ35_00330 [Patescibacteria group bacterium]|nr:hypothetical protein [Patescibacteria group bacterium]